jgi:hypothetical protein
MSNHPVLAIRTSSNPFHHLWNNNGTWWCHYTVHLPDFTKQRIRQNLHTTDSTTARRLRDAILSSAQGVVGGVSSTGAGVPSRDGSQR